MCLWLLEEQQLQQIGAQQEGKQEEILKETISIPTGYWKNTIFLKTLTRKDGHASTLKSTNLYIVEFILFTKDYERQNNVKYSKGSLFPKLSKLIINMKHALFLIQHNVQLPHKDILSYKSVSLLRNLILTLVNTCNLHVAIQTTVRSLTY